MVEQQVYLARQTAIEMLEDRGFNRVSGIKNYSYSHFNEIYKHFNNYSAVFDIEAINEKGHRTIVKFIKDINNDKLGTELGINGSGDVKSTKTEINDLYNFIKSENNFTNNDTIVFVICYGENLHEVHTNLEKILKNCQIFHIKNLVFNITKHKYVPKHELVPKNEISSLKFKLNIDSVQKLPAININDPVARYFNMKHGDVCRILRPSPNTKIHIFYRVCIDDSDFFF